MRRDWWALSNPERESFDAAVIFLENRLAERETIKWALNLRPDEKSKRLAIRELVRNSRRTKISSPWLDTWHLVVESWNEPIVERHSSMGVYDVKHRLDAGERTKGLVSAIVELVSPHLQIRLIDEDNLTNRKKPKTIDDLISCTLTSGSLLDIEVLKLEKIEDKGFLASLASALDDVILSSLDLAQRIGWDGHQNYWVVGQMHRVYYVKEKNENGRTSDPDEFGHGVVPAVKLLYDVLARLADVDLGSTAIFVARWRLTDSQIYLRLLAALSRDQRITSNDDLGDFFSKLNSRQFWDLRFYPEIAELRAKRFMDLGPETQRRIINRIKKGPPRSHWPRDVDQEQVKDFRQHNAVREMKRICLAGANLIPKDLLWLEGQVAKFPDLEQMNRIDEGFAVSLTTRSIEQIPDLRFDSMQEEARLVALEKALSSRRSWPYEGNGDATGWIQLPANCLQLISDFESVGDGVSNFPKVWERFGWDHSPVAQAVETAERDTALEADRVLTLLEKLRIETITEAIGGISHWLSSWSKQLLDNKKGNPVWFKVWPIAVEATNSAEEGPEADLDMVAQVTGDQKPKDLDTLNSPVGKLISVFLHGCPTLKGERKPFAKGQPLRKMRGVIFSSDERSLLIAQHRAVEFVSYFFQADKEWTQENLIAPLREQSDHAVLLWRSLARRFHKEKVLQIIGDEMVARTQDKKLGRESRCRLVENLAVECLHAFWFKRDPEVDFYKVQQVLRSVEDEVRSSGAEIVHRFVRDSSNPQKNTEKPLPSPEDLYSVAVKPFLQEVWPQERSLATPGVSQAFADLPVAVGNAFADAVRVIERFLVPFDCWSLGDFGLYRVASDDLVLAVIDSAEKAEAFLKLLDLTIGTQEGSVVPSELARGLDRIRQLSPHLSDNRAFRRLEATARK